MASFKKQYLWQGFRLTRSTVDRRQDVGVIRSRLTGGADASTDLFDATEFLLNSADDTFPGTTLPLNTVRVTGYSNTDQYARAIYRYPETSYTPEPAQQLVTERTGFEGVEWYQLPFAHSSPNTPAFDTDGFPNGDFNGVDDDTDPDDEPVPYVWRMPTYQLYVFTTLDFNPTTDVISLEGKLNSAAVTWGGHSFAAETLRFNTAIVDWRQERDELMFDVRYSFTAKPAWKIQSVRYDNSASQWKAVKGTTYQTASFGGAFPVHA